MQKSDLALCKNVLGDPEVKSHILQIDATFPIRIRKITVQICGLLGHPVYSSLVIEI